MAALFYDRHSTIVAALSSGQSGRAWDFGWAFGFVVRCRL
jgi:hypothetical protein